jgi:hypothetical protein
MSWVISELRFFSGWIGRLQKPRGHGWEALISHEKGFDYERIRAGDKSDFARSKPGTNDGRFLPAVFVSELTGRPQNYTIVLKATSSPEVAGIPAGVLLLGS